MRTPSNGLKLLLVLAASAVAACSEGDGNADTSTVADNNIGGSGAVSDTKSDAANPCSLVSVSDLSGIVKDPAVEAKETTQGSLDSPTCGYFDGEGYQVFQVVVYEGGAAEYDALRHIAKGGPIPGLGQDAVADRGGVIVVKTSEVSFLAQSVDPVADGKVSAEIKAATQNLGMEPEIYEASYRLAKVIIDKL